MKTILLFLFFVGVQILSSCDDSCSSPAGAEIVNIGDTVEIVSGIIYWNNEGEFGLEYVELKDDSRCPINVNCVWEGDAVVVFDMMCVDNINTIKLHHNPDFEQSSKINEVVVKLVDILPYKIVPDTLEWKNYHPIVTFLKE